MKDRRIRSRFDRALGLVCILSLLFFPAGSLLLAQDPAQSPPAQPLSPEQLDNLVAPVALYPDSLLSQVFVAATYPLEVVEAAQFVQQNRNLKGYALVDAARQQNWDPSIQALVVFPDVLNLLSSNIRWTTDLGNAFLAQQADVMNAVQRMRAQAQAAGRLNSNAQETVTSQYQDGRSVIEIAPANPEIVYVPVYDPEYIWGPPVWGYYPPLYYPAYGFGFGSGIFIGSYFGGLGWGGWGWGPNWFNCSIIERPYFFNHYGYRGWGGFRGFGRDGVWAHNPEHRLGIPYPNRAVASRFGGGFGGNANGFNRAGFGPGYGFGRRNPAVNSRGAFPGPSRGNPRAGGWQRFGAPGAGRSLSPQPGIVTNRQNSFGDPSANRGAGSWGRFGSPGSQPSYRSNPAFNGGARAPSYSPNSGGARAVPGYRSNPSFGGGYRSAPSFGGGGRPAPAFNSGGGFRGGGGGGFRSAPSFGGGRPAPVFNSGGGFRGGGGGFRGGGGGGFRGGSGGGGGGFRGGSGGGSHGGGGGRRR